MTERKKDQTHIQDRVEVLLNEFFSAFEYGLGIKVRNLPKTAWESFLKELKIIEETIGPDFLAKFEFIPMQLSEQQVKALLYSYQYSDASQGTEPRNFPVMNPTEPDVVRVTGKYRSSAGGIPAEKPIIIALWDCGGGNIGISGMREQVLNANARLHKK